MELGQVSKTITLEPKPSDILYTGKIWGRKKQVEIYLS